MTHSYFDLSTLYLVCSCGIDVITLTKEIFVNVLIKVCMKGFGLDKGQVIYNVFSYTDVKFHSSGSFFGERETSTKSIEVNKKTLLMSELSCLMYFIRTHLKKPIFTSKLYCSVNSL